MDGFYNQCIGAGAIEHLLSNGFCENSITEDYFNNTYFNSIIT